MTLLSYIEDINHKVFKTVQRRVDRNLMLLIGIETSDHELEVQVRIGLIQGIAAI